MTSRLPNPNRRNRTWDEAIIRVGCTFIVLLVLAAVVYLVLALLKYVALVVF